MAKFIKNVSFDGSSKLNNRGFGNSNEVEVLDFSDDDLSLNGKYVDENGNSFSAEYYYDSDGTYNTKYRDGNKNVNVKFNVDGSMRSTEFVYVNDDNL